LVLAPSTRNLNADTLLHMIQTSAAAERPTALDARMSHEAPSPDGLSNGATKGHDVERHQAIVVGAGSSGLAAAVALRRCGFETIVIEKSDTIGTSWRSRYDELRLNSWRPMSKLQGRGMPRQCGRYPSRDDVVAYLERFARQHGVALRLRTKLLEVQRERHIWRLETSSGKMLCRYLVIATGWDAVPCMPWWPGATTFDSELIHSSEFTSAAAYAGREVLVVGAGNSGLDIASHLVRAGARVTLSMRTPPNLAVREVFGIPGQPILVFFGDHAPHVVADAMFRIVQRMTFGDLRRYGIPRSPIGVYANYREHQRNPAVDDGFIGALKRGTARVVGIVERLEGGDVVLADGARLRPDAVICATGYRRGLESLVGHLGILGDDGIPVHHAGVPDHPRAPRLYFCGMWGQFSGQIRLGPIHARRIARAASLDRRMRYRVFVGGNGRVHG
jgi:putative flavoprotein involved in K+ transport